MQLAYKLQINAISHCPEEVNDKLCNIHESYAFLIQSLSFSWILD